MDPTRWKVQKTIKDLESFKGSGTSMVTIFIRAGAQVAPMRQKLVEELGTASNIKSRVCDCGCKFCTAIVKEL